jgi:hypothetical protein
VIKLTAPIPKKQHRPCQNAIKQPDSSNCEHGFAM